MASSTRTPTPQLFSLEGKTVIATGGTGGLGSEMLLAMAESGADTIVSIHMPGDPLQIKLEEAVKGAGRKCIGFKCDVGKSQDVRAVFDNIWQAGIVPDILLNCAGVNRRDVVEKMTDENIDLIFSINLKGSYVAAQEFGKQLLKLQRPGKIINIGSFTSFVPMTNVSAYAASKGGVLQMTKAFSNEWAEHGIQIKTPLAQAALDKYPDMEEYIVKRTPAGRWGHPSDLRGVALFLASPASDFVTGTSITVDGGMQFR